MKGSPPLGRFTERFGSTAQLALSLMGQVWESTTTHA